jgi:hypothetical protein
MHSYPASTSHTCVLPLRTSGRSHFSLDTGPMPAALIGRLSETEYLAVIQRVNKVLQPLTYFGLSSLLLPFLAIDAVSVALLYAIDPTALVAPLSLDLPDLLLPMLLELAFMMCALPLVALLVGRRIRLVQSKAREVLDEAARRYAVRGLHFSLKLGVHSAGAASNMWMETQV